MRTVDFWEANAARYDVAVAPLERAFLGPARPWLARRARGRILLVGVGTGADLDHVPAGSPVTAVDLSPAMLARARERLAGLGRREGEDTHLLVADAERLPFPDASFDTVWCSYALCEVPDVRAALAEFVRVLAPGGELLLADHVVSTSAIVRVLQRVLDKMTAQRGEHWTRRPLLELAGLGVETVETHRRTLGALEWVHARRICPPTAAEPAS